MVETVKGSYDKVKAILTSLGVEIGFIGILLWVGGIMNTIPIRVGGYSLADWYWFVVGGLVGFTVILKLLLIMIAKLKEEYIKIKEIN